MNTDVELENSTGSESPAKRHEFLWLKDGNVVLGTNVYLFKVHKSVLSMHSSVFRDMFELPTEEDLDMGSSDIGAVGMAPELYEGVHFVSLSDDGREMEHILRAVYERGYYDPHSDEGTLEKFTALLRLSCKYDFSVIRKDVLGHLSRLYPTYLEDYDNAAKAYLEIFGNPRSICHLPLLKAAAEAGIDDHFPSLYYASSGSRVIPILNIFLKSPSHYPTMHRLIDGQQSLGKAIQDLMGAFIMLTERCICVHMNQYHPDIFDGEEIPEVFCTHNLVGLSSESLFSKKFPLRACNLCKESFSRRIEEEREAIWEAIPSFYRFNKTWDEIRAELPTQ
ncbi:hypothetical protein SCHPADRAFT_35694 [Schizopora paradoxa]|uniref:BTB domain-containing protein n=1 Tax=Schizopora paradoxa TaxID=27342 RepID=A0A0H2SER4_9AGAM|nr:hypothetical protein SCHPADRAFT_35694 [Schizopora paradoxa]